jgi:protein-L-isoaspartate(D-aspartate) O-methyltransferase
MSSDHDPAQQHRVARQAMVRDQLSARGIADPAVLRAMGELPRERFLPESMQYAAYDDRALPVGEDQTISQPYIVAYMTEKLAVRPGNRVLEIGTGTGYQTAVLCRMQAVVYTVERIARLQNEARERLTAMGLSPVEFRCGDGTLGWPEHAPYDRILVTAGAPDIPRTLIEQLAGDGRLVAPVGRRDCQTLVRVDRQAGRTVETSLIPVRFVKLIGRHGWEG